MRTHGCHAYVTNETATNEPGQIGVSYSKYVVVSKFQPLTYRSRDMGIYSYFLVTLTWVEHYFG